jgi:hypothetical protein
MIKPPSHNGSAPVLNTGPFGHPGSIPGGGVPFLGCNRYGRE